MRLDLIEFPADDLARARRFWESLLEVSLDERREGEGSGPADPRRSPVARASLPDLARALERVVKLEGANRGLLEPRRRVVHPGERWAICRDSEGSPFGLAAE
jgi:predicted enzyme related to lactoylglutathione lyase